DQEDGFGKAVIMKATPEMDARLDREDVKGIDVELELLERERLHDLHEIGAQGQHIAAAEADRDPELAAPFHRVEDRAGDTYRRACGFIDQPANLHVKGISRLGALRLQCSGGLRVRDRGDQGIGEILRNDLLAAKSPSPSGRCGRRAQRALRRPPPPASPTRRLAEWKEPWLRSAAPRAVATQSLRCRWQSQWRARDCCW